MNRCSQAELVISSGQNLVLSLTENPDIRRRLSKNIPGSHPPTFQTALQSLRPHLLSPLSSGCPAWA